MATNRQDSNKSDRSSKPVVCFLGPISSYTHQATLATLPADQFELMPVTTIKDIFDTTQSGVATYGVVPFENSTNGSVVFTLDYFADRSNVYGDLNVCREIYLDVHHCLLGHISSSGDEATTPSAPTSTSSSTGAAAAVPPLHPISHVRRVYSHPQAFGQCTAFLGTWLRGIETVDVSSTSRAAQLALDDETGESAAISSAAAAAALGHRIDVLARNIEDRSDNTTRFFVLRKGIDTPTPTPTPTPLNQEEEETEETEVQPATKSLLSFTVPHRSPGALADVLSCFRRAGLNLTSINSRPALSSNNQDSAFEYIFFVEFEGHRFRDPRGRVGRVLDDVAAVARTSRWLGSWENMRETKG